MSSSQHRPGAMVSLSPAAYAKDKMKKVENLENQLANVPSKKNDEQKSKLRVQLCEMLSDIILKAPLPALKHDCVGHLWRHCFYGTISTLRQRISKEKKKGGPNISKLQNTLSTFISEAVTLYDYLIDQYQRS
jgi:Telomerase activating protein Est1